MAGHIVTIAQQKGGAGKTTLAAHLAVAWAVAGKKVALVDIDPQASLSQWYGERPAGTVPALHLSTVAGWRAEKELRTLAEGHDLVVVDSPPHAETEARIAVRNADLVIVPVQPSPMDLWATRPTLDLAAGEGTAALAVLNRVPPRARVADEVAARLAALGVAVATSQIGNRTGFAAAMMEGLTVMDGSRRSTARDEIAALAAEIESRLAALPRRRR
jgi:chromosome partitioning protein